MKTVAIIEDQTAIREMVSQAVIDKDAFEVIIESGDGRTGCEACLEQRPDFVILDVMLPNLNGTEILKVFREKLPGTQILIFSGYQSPSLVRELLQAGAHGFVEKSAPLSELRKGVEIVASGGSYFGPEVALLLRDAMADPKSNDSVVNILT